MARSSNLAMLVMEIIRSNRAQREKEKDRAYDAYRLMEQRNWQKELTEDTREYNESIKRVEIADKKADMHEEKYNKVLDLALASNISLDNLSKIEKSDDNITSALKVLEDTNISELTTHADLIDYYEKEANSWQARTNLLTKTIASTTNEVAQTIAGGIASDPKYSEGKGFGADPEGWDALDLGFSAWLETNRKKDLNVASQDFFEGLASSVIEGDPIPHVDKVKDIWQTSLNPEATYVDENGATVVVGNDSLGAFKGMLSSSELFDKTKISQLTESSIDSLEFSSTYDYDPSSPDAEASIVKDLFADKGGEIVKSLEDKGTKERAESKGWLYDLQAQTYQFNLEQKERELAQGQLGTYIVRSADKTFIDSKTEARRMLAENTNLENEDKATFDQLEDRIKQIDYRISELWLMAVDRESLANIKLNYDEGKPDAEQYELVKRRDAISDYENMYSSSQGAGAKYLGTTANVDYADFYAYFGEAMENYRNSEGALEREQIREAIISIFGLPANADLEREYVRVGALYNRTTGVGMDVVPIDFYEPVLQASADPFDEDETERLENTQLKGLIK